MNDATPETAKSRSVRRQNLVLIGIALLLALLLTAGIAYQHGRFSSMHDVYFLADDVTALTPGTTVRLSGFRVGKVASMELQDDLKVKVVLNVEADAFAHLRSDARADLVREQLKPAAIDLRAGSSAQPLSGTDPRIAFARRGTLTEIAEDLRARLAPILADVKQVTGSLSERKADLEAVLANSRALTQELVTTAKAMRSLSAGLQAQVGQIGAQSAATLGQARQSLAHVDALVGKATQSLDAVNSRLPALLQRADGTLANLEAVTHDARGLSGAAATQLPPLIDDSHEIVQGLRQAWPLRTLVAPPPPLLLPIDSQDSQDAQDHHAASAPASR